MANVTVKKTDYTAAKSIFQNTIMEIQLIERGILAINSDSLRPELLKHLMREHASLFINCICHLIARDEDLQWPNANPPQIGCSPKASSSAKIGYNVTENRFSVKKKGDDQMLDKGEADEWDALNFSIVGKFTLIHILFFRPDKPTSLVQLYKSGYMIDQLSNPNSITSDQRNHLVKLLEDSTSPSLQKAALALSQLNSLLRICTHEPDLILSTTVNGSKDSILSHHHFYTNVDSLASCGLGMDLCCALRRTDNKRKKEEKSRAREWALQMELPISEAVKNILSDPYSDVSISAPVVAHAAVCLLAQALVGCPVSVPGRLVADLAKWVINRVAQLQLDSEVTGDAKTKTTESPAVMYLMNCTNDSFSPLVELADSVAELARLRSKAEIQNRQRKCEVEAADRDESESSSKLYSDKMDEISSLMVKTDAMLRKIPGLMA
ncbi:unnamed protein product [Protopolystoma xenopodis]|uniref:E3 UFM1-protein ligase 1-like domain-containing protein n=1 Tax=Protopolystoma xenopodis TaxID=117903 RepID=A0A448WGJ6_9PLAT|nr:unnamed protein product [Protopolystoma xenopodis]